MTTPLVLRMVGDESDWQYLSEAWRRVFEPAPRDEGETTEDFEKRCAALKASAEESAALVGDAAIKVRVVDDRTLAAIDEAVRLGVAAMEDAAKPTDDQREAARLKRMASEAEVDADRTAITAALAGISGFDQTEVNEALVNALCVSPHRWIIAYTCRGYQRAHGAGRAGFFTRAPVG